MVSRIVATAIGNSLLCHKCITSEGVERANEEKRGRKRRRVGNKGERGTRNKEEK